MLFPTTMERDFFLPLDIKRFFFLENVVTPLPQIKGVQVTTTISTPSPSSSISLAISPAERKKYQAIYQAQRPTSNGVPANTAKALFAKSRLSNDQLSQIWYVHFCLAQKCSVSLIFFSIGTWLIFERMDI